MCGIDGLLLPSSRNFISIVPLEIQLLRKLMTYSVLILSALSINCELLCG